MGSNSILILLGILFFVLVVAASFLRIKKKYEITVSDLTIAIVPFFLGLVLTGTISELTVGGVTAKFDKVVNETVPKKDYEVIKLEKISAVGKSEPVIDTLNKYRLKNPEALNFEFGGVHVYDERIVNIYIGEIPSLKFFIINQAKTNQFIGFIEVDNYNHINDKTNFINAITNGNLKDFNDFRSYGLITRQHALTTSSTKKEALNNFSENTYNVWPVLESDEFTGVLRREVLTSGLLQEIFEKME